MPELHPHDESANSAPLLRTEEKPDEERRITWAELLNDLVFTVIIAQLANRLLTHLSAQAIGEFFLLYIPVWWLWNGETHYSTRFDHERDVMHRLLGSLQLLGLIVLAADIPQALESRSFIFAATYAAVRTVLLVEYGRAWYHVPEARPYIRHVATGFAISVLIWAGSVFIEPPYRYGLWAIALIIELSTPLTSSGGKLHRDFPPDVRHLPERYGQFTLLVLGQSVTGVTLGLIQSNFQPHALLTTMLGGVVIIGLWWAYFDRIDDDAVRQVSVGGSAGPYAFWLYLHLPLTIALTIVGVGLTYAIRGSARAELTEAEQWLFTGAVAGYLATQAGISITTLKAGPSHLSFVWGISVRLGLAVSLVIVRLCSSLNALWLIGITAVAIVGLIISDHLSPSAPESTERVKRVRRRRKK